MSADDRDLAAMWGTRVVRARYAGHEGLLYASSPSSIPQLLTGGERWSARDLLVQGDRRITHGEFRQAVPVAAGLLAELGVKANSRVLLAAYNCPEFMLAAWAAWWLGAVPVFANRWWSESELAGAVDLTDPAVIVTDLPEVPPDRTALPISSLAAAFGRSTAVPRPPAPPADPDAPAVVVFTSGSSGAPKGVELSQRAVIVNQQNLLVRSRRLPQTLDPAAPQQVRLVTTPLFHVGGVSTIITSLLTGDRLVLTTGRFDPREVLRLIASEGVHNWGGVPTMAIRVLDDPAFDEYDLSSLRSLPLGGAPVPQALLRRIAERLPRLEGRGMSNTWGMTETGGFVTVAGSGDLERRPGTVGRPYPCAEIRIDRPDERGVGEILVRSPTVMLGYLGEEDGPVDGEGWLRTGDLGRVDEDGYLYVTGRRKDIVIRGGENIASAHVEQVLLDHPEVVEAVVFGVPHETLGEELAAAVTHRPGSRITAEDLERHCRARLAYFEVPSRWRLGDRRPQTLAGEKIDKRAVRESFLREAGLAAPPGRTGA